MLWDKFRFKDMVPILHLQLKSALKSIGKFWGNLLRETVPTLETSIFDNLNEFY